MEEKSKEPLPTYTVGGPTVLQSCVILTPVFFRSIYPFHTVDIGIPETKYDWQGASKPVHVDSNKIVDSLTVQDPSRGTVKIVIKRLCTASVVEFTYNAEFDVTSHPSGRPLGTKIAESAKQVLVALLEQGCVTTEAKAGLMTLLNKDASFF